MWRAAVVKLEREQEGRGKVKAVVEEVMGLRRGEGDETEGRFLAESENGGAGEKGGDFPGSVRAWGKDLFVIYKQCGRRENAVYYNNKRMRGK